MGLAFINGLATGAAVTVLVTMIASVTLLPAFLGFAQHRIEVTRWRGILAAGFVAIALLGVGLGIQPLLVGAPIAVIILIASFAYAPLRKELPPRKEKPLRQTLAYRWSRFVQHRPWSIAILTTIFLLLLSIPVLSLRLGFSDESNFAESSTTRQAYDLTSAAFGPGANGPLILTAELAQPQDLQVMAELAETLNRNEGVADVLGPIPNTFGDPASAEAAIIRVTPTTGPQDAATDELVKSLRSDVVPSVTDGTDVVVNVSGAVAANIDFSSYLAQRLPIFFVAVLTLSFLLLMMVFRSLLVPLKAVIMNMLSIGAAYGIVVMVFQWGWGASLFDTAGGPIEPFLPMMMFAIVFGLSMDYEVFLLSRVKEEYDRTGDPVNSVSDGLAATARVITAAAAIMIVVFGSFVLEDNRIIKMFGLGLSSAVFLDATLVRMLLVPATMELLGARNWWLPRWLDRLLPTLNVEGGTHTSAISLAHEEEAREKELVDA
jgi:RND superfamily putative drug exporter